MWSFVSITLWDGYPVGSGQYVGRLFWCACAFPAIGSVSLDDAFRFVMLLLAGVPACGVWYGGGSL